MDLEFSVEVFVLGYLELTKVDFHDSDPKNVFWPSSLKTCISLKMWVQEIIILKQFQNQPIFRPKQSHKFFFKFLQKTALAMLMKCL